jgi:hypothetical protein
LATVQNGGLIIYTEDSIKMSIKLYSFIEQKNRNWQDEYRFKCADNSYKYVLDRGFLLKTKMAKPLEWTIKISQSKRRRAAT